MKIDLHCHTKKIKKGDPITRNVCEDIFAEKIRNADVKIVAITNHNTFDYEQYKSFKARVREFCDVWPGIELDARGDCTKKGEIIKFHIIIVSNPDKVENFNSTVSKLMNGFNVDEDTFHISEICQAFKNLDVLYIPHYLGKQPAITDDDLDLLRKSVSDASRVFTETTESSIGVLINNDFHALVGSDVRDWNNYEDSMFSDLRLPVSSYEQFCMLAKRDNVVIDTILNKKKSNIYVAKPHENVKIRLKIFEDVNIIFGQKGTGKSEILNSLYDEMIKQGLNCVKYTGSQKEEDFSKILSTSEMTPNCELLSVDKCDNEINLLKSWKDSNITIFSEYIKWYETRNNNANKKSMKITDAVNLPISDNETLLSARKDRNSLKEIIKNISKIRPEKYLNALEYDQLKKLLDKLDYSILNTVIKAYNENKSIDLTNYSIEKIKELADKKTDTVSKPSSTGFLEYAQFHIQLKKTTSKILAELKKEQYSEKKNIGELEDKGKIYVKSIYRMLCSESRTDEFRKGINILKKIREVIQNINSEYYKADITSKTEELSTLLTDNGIISLEDFLGLSKIIIDCNENKYEPSNGEKGILLLQQAIKEDATAYFFDEPELGMGNSYIDSTIRPQISDLAKRHKIVVVVTHNANLAVRTLPYMTIFRKYNNGNYLTYTGNPFRNELVNIENELDLLNWTEESMHTLEGGKEAFYERKEIYESGSNQC